MSRPSLTSYACLAAAVLSLIALADLPYGYYMLLRWAVSIAAAMAAYSMFSRGLKLGPVLAALVLILFNPLFPMRLDREVWAVLNVVVAVLMVGFAWAARERAVVETAR